MKTALVIGAGPAGLMAAEELSKAGLSVVVADAKPSPARKFLMAGKSGLNLTKSEPISAFLSHIHGPDSLRKIVAGFGPDAVQDWARDLGQEVFTGSSGRVFPKVMKASPLLRNWLARLDQAGVELRRNWRWVGIADGAKQFETPEGLQTVQADVTVLALGGASWARLGSDGEWVSILAQNSVSCAPFQPANMGFIVAWSTHMARHFGQPVKSVRVTAGDQSVLGEFVISSRGIEGSAIYAVSRAMRDGAPLTLDLLPGRSLEDITARLSRPRGKASLSNHLRKTLKLDPVKTSLLQEFSRPLPSDPAELAALIKALPIPHQGPRPLDEAISTAGGLSFEALDEGLMIKALPGVFACGEMLDWEAPTGGYLLTTCFATGRHAGRAAADYARR
ncbi:TIGR03862 family flavoprotein [uncultured Aliiroseovarius sp.]|uniref:TIGR03862 family flavoprotein n=1 Tax=uncultured Aliiroseovarius sp. TaxID=1658783 RepID=UPI00262A2D1F|nr:TIGR03862 family flavoprotein [uncultured Aliiroseovarius sp.]